MGSTCRISGQKNDSDNGGANHRNKDSFVVENVWDQPLPNFGGINPYKVTDDYLNALDPAIKNATPKKKHNVLILESKGIV